MASYSSEKSVRKNCPCTVSRAAVRVQMRSPLPYTVNRPFASRRHSLFHQRTTPCKNARSPSGRRSGIRQGGCKTRAAAVGTARAASRGVRRSWCALAIVVPPVPRFVHCTAHASIYMEGEGMLMSKSCKPLHPGLFFAGCSYGGTGVCRAADLRGSLPAGSCALRRAAAGVAVSVSGGVGAYHA